MIRTQLKTLQIKKSSDRELPKILKWKTANMVRNHSIMATVREIIQVSKSLDVVHIGIIGNPGTGKSETAKTLCHLIHKLSEVPFAIRIFGKNDLLNFEETLKTLTPANYVLVFDDVSFLGAGASKKQIEFVKQAMTEIRHLEGGKDVKIITILNYHYTLGLDKYLRQADFRYFTSIGSSEMDNMEKIVGAKNMKKVRDFQIRFTKAIVRNFFTFRIGPKESFAYKYREPFIPLLFYNNSDLRPIVSPLRIWLDPICSRCSQGSSSSIDVKQFVREAEAKFQPRTFKTAVKHLLMLNGMNVHSKPIVSAARYLDRALEKKIINLEDLAVHCGLTITKTRLRKPLDGVLTT